MTIKKAALILAVSAVITGCQTTNPYTGTQEVNKTSIYAGIGAVSGAIIGGIADGGSGALKGAALGGAAGGGYGYYVDKQESLLRAELANTGVKVSRTGDNLQLIMPSNITFDSGQSGIKSSFYPVLGSVAKVFKEFDKNLIEVVGHTDSTGGDKINFPLSQERANSVAQYLAHQGVSTTRLKALGQGSFSPIADNKSAEGRAANRRVEINILPAPKA